MKHKIELLEKVKGAFNDANGVRNQKLMHPKRDWVIGLGLFFVIVAAGAVWNMGTHRGYQYTQRNAAEVTLPVQYQEAKVQSVITAYENRSAQVEFIRTQPTAGSMSDTPVEVNTATGSSTVATSSATTTGETEVEVDTTTATTAIDQSTSTPSDEEL